MTVVTQKRIRVLVVDDCPKTRVLLRKQLERRSIHVEEAGDGAAALATMLSQKQFDLVLADWDMPRMNGLELLERVKANPQLSETRVMMVSGQSKPHRIEEALKAGAIDYLIKPFDPALLSDKLSWLGVDF